VLPAWARASRRGPSDFGRALSCFAVRGAPKALTTRRPEEIVTDLERIAAAAERAAPHVLRTPVVPLEGVWLKLECLQPTGSFKVRGFFAAALALPPEQLRRGLITVSAGNAALACAYVAHRLGVPRRVAMYEAA